MYMIRMVEEDDMPIGEAGQFLNTHWSVVLLASQGNSPQAEAALETLCRNYWYPLYSFVRRQGYSPADAQDLTQEFFAQLLGKQRLQLADRERGRFRSFLLASLKNFLVNEWVRGQAQKRGGGIPALSLDEAIAEELYRREPDSPTAPEILYDKRWAITLLERAVERLTAHYTQTGKEQLFNTLKPWLLAETSHQIYDDLAKTLGMNEGSVKVALHRLRQRLREAVRDEVSHTVASPADVDEELRCLMASLNT